MFINKEIDCLFSEGIINLECLPGVRKLLSLQMRITISVAGAPITLVHRVDACPLPRIKTLINDLAKCHVFSTFDLHRAYHKIRITKKDGLFTGFEAYGKLWEFTRIPFGVTNRVPVFPKEKII